MIDTSASSSSIFFLSMITAGVVAGLGGKETAAVASRTGALR